MIGFRVLAFEVLRQGVVITWFKQLGSHLAPLSIVARFSQWQADACPPHRHFSCGIHFERSRRVIRVRRFLSFARSFLATAFRIMFMPASGLGSVGAGMEEILSSSAPICREISSALFALFLIRTPGPPPSSAMNSTLAFSSAAMIFSPVAGRPPRSPPAASSRLMVGIETPDAQAIAPCDQPSNSRAALICLTDTFCIDKGKLQDHIRYR